MARTPWRSAGSMLAITLACQPRADVEPQPRAGTLIEPYLAIGEILAADQTEGIAAHGTALAAAARAGDDQPRLDEIAVAAGELSELAQRHQLEPARAVYREISHDLLDILDAAPEQREGLTLAYCPMTFANEGGYWLQRGETLRNPYEGSRMLHCGASLTWEAGVEHRARWAEASGG